MPSSLRARLLGWYSLILILTITTFAATVGFLLWRGLLADVDRRLQASGAQLVQALRPAGGGEFNLDLPSEFQPVEVDDQSVVSYYAVWSPQGEVIDRSPVAVDVPRPSGAGIHTRDGWRELALEGADGALVLVGRDLANARSAVRSFVGTSVVGGVAALALSIAGGWFLVGRALAPIDRINRAAAAMAGGDLAARIVVERTESELEHVAEALNNAFDRLHRALEGQRRFTADASHELRTPLATLGAEIEWARARPRSTDEYRESMATCQRAADRMIRLVDRLLTLARADHHAGHPPRAVEFEAIVRNAVEEVRPLALRKGIALDARLAPATVKGDPDRLIEMATNLCANAVEYNREGGSVLVEVWVEGREACLRVRDSGMGISAADLPHIFDRFYRPDRARDGRTGGAGLGLAITKAIVDAHHGHLSCQSTLGAGTEMVVRMPRLS